MTEHDAFLQAILEAPEDDFPRLVYADWLEEIGNDPLRAEFIRVQCKLAETIWPCDCGADNQKGCICPAIIALRHREIELLHLPFENPNEQLWTKATLPSLVSLLDRPDIIRTYHYRRGFIADVEITCENWINHGHRLTAALPLERVNLLDFVFGLVRSDAPVRLYPSLVVRRSQYYRPRVVNRQEVFQVRKGQLFRQSVPDRLGHVNEFKYIPTMHVDHYDQDFFNRPEEFQFETGNFETGGWVS